MSVLLVELYRCRLAVLWVVDIMRYETLVNFLGWVLAFTEYDW